MAGLLLLGWAAVLIATAEHLRPPPARCAGLLPGPSRSPQRRARTVLLGVAALAGGLLWLPLGVAVVVALAAAPRVRARRARARERTQVVHGLPELADLLVLAVGTGLNPLLALRRVTPLAPPAYAAALTEVLRRVDRGVRLGDAIEHLTERLGSAVHPVVAALTATERYGTPLGPALDALAHDARRERRRLAEEAARRLPVRLAFPLAGCILPAFVLLTVAPLVAGSFTSLHLSGP
jgi:tight adherence protein C